MKQKTLLKSGAQAESSGVREPRRTALPRRGSQSWVLWRWGLISGLPLPSRFAHAHVWSGSGLFLVACTSLSQYGFQRECFWEVGRIYYGLASPPSFRPLLILLVGGSLSVPCSLLGPSLVRQLMQAVIFMPGQGGRFRSTVP